MRVILADDHKIFRRGLKAIIDGHSPLTVCGEAENGQQAIDLIVELKPDLIILDLSMPVLNGLQATTKIRQLAPSVRILILSMHDSPHAERAALAAGADAFLTKMVSAETLIRTVTTLLDIRFPHGA